MADFGAPVAQNVQSPNLQTLSDIIGFKQRQQTLQTGQYLQQSAAAQASLDTRTAQERSNLSQIDWKSFKNTDGSFDMDKVSSAALQAAPTTGQDFVERFGKMVEGSAGVKKAYYSLNQEYQQNLRSALGSWAGDPNSNIGELLDQVDAIKDNVPDSSKEAVRKIVNHTLGIMSSPNLMTGSPKTLAEQKRDALGFSRAGLSTQDVSGAGGIATPAAGTVNTGTQVLPTTTNRETGVTQAANAPPVAKVQIPPGFSVVTDQRTGNPYLLNHQTGETQDMGYGYPGRQAGAAAPPASMPKPYYPGQGEDIGAFQHEVQTVRQEAQKAPLSHNINAQILRLSQDAKTGPGSDAWQHVIGAVGAPFGLSPTASYQEVGKFLEKNAIAAMQDMGGPPSDSRLEAAAKANGGTSFSPEALRTVTKFNDATTSALDQYRQGMDHAVGMGQNVNYTNLPKFKAEWAKNFDVDIFRIENAIRDGDRAELAKIKTELGPEKLKALATKRKNLTALSQVGALPNE